MSSDARGVGLWGVALAACAVVGGATLAAGSRVGSAMPLMAGLVALTACAPAAARMAGQGRGVLAAVTRLGGILLVFPLANVVNKTRAAPWWSLAVLAVGFGFIVAVRRAVPDAGRPVPTVRGLGVRLGIALWTFAVGVGTGWFALVALSTPIAPDSATYWATLPELFQQNAGQVLVRTPLYSLVFAGLHGIGGTGLHLIALQLGLRALAGALVAFVLARTSPLGAFALGTLLALDPVSAAAGVAYLTESLFTTGLLLGLAVAVSQLERGRTVRAWELAAAGLLFGWASFFRPNGMALVAPLALAYLVVTRSIWRTALPLAGVATVAGGIFALNWIRTGVLSVAATGVYLAFPLFSQHLFHPDNGPVSAAMDVRLRACFPDLDYTKVVPLTSNEYIHTKFSPCLIRDLEGGHATLYRMYGEAYAEAIRARPLLFTRQIALETARFLAMTIAYFPAATAQFADHTDIARFCAHEPPFADYQPAFTAFVCPMPATNAAWRAEAPRIGFATRMLFQPYLYFYEPHLHRVGYYEARLPELAGAAGVLFFALVVAAARPPYGRWAGGAALLALYMAASTAFGQVAMLRYVAMTSPFLLLVAGVFLVTVAEDVGLLARAVRAAPRTQPRAVPCVIDHRLVPDGAATSAAELSDPTGPPP